MRFIILAKLSKQLGDGIYKYIMPCQKFRCTLAAAKHFQEKGVWNPPIH